MAKNTVYSNFHIQINLFLTSLLQQVQQDPIDNATVFLYTDGYFILFKYSLFLLLFLLLLRALRRTRNPKLQVTQSRRISSMKSMGNQLISHWLLPMINR